MRVCSLCHQNLPESQFGTNAMAPDGKQSRCFECRNVTEYVRRYRTFPGAMSRLENKLGQIRDHRRELDKREQELLALISHAERVRGELHEE